MMALRAARSSCRDHCHDPRNTHVTITAMASSRIAAQRPESRNLYLVTAATAELAQRDDVTQERPGFQEVREVLAVLGTGQPRLTALGGVQARIVPLQGPFGRALACLRRADNLLGAPPVGHQGWAHRRYPPRGAMGVPGPAEVVGGDSAASRLSVCWGAVASPSGARLSAGVGRSLPALAATTAR